MGGRFTLSDDSHGVEHVGLNYKKVLTCIERAEITELCVLAPAFASTKPHDERFPGVYWNTISTEDLKAHSFWAN